MTDAGMESFTKNIGDGLVHLKKLDINFAEYSFCTKININND